MRASLKIRSVAFGSALAVMLAAGLVAAQSASAVATAFTFTPAFGAVGTTVTLTATGAPFAAVSSVTFNSFAAVPIGVSGASIQANVPAGATDGPIRIVDSGVTLTSATNFNVTSAPTVTALSTVCGIAGSTVTFTGTDLDATSSITFGGTPAVLGTKTATTVVATVPGGPSGFVPVVVSNGVAPDANTAFYVGTCPQVLSSVVPTSGSVGTQVTITASGFTPNADCDAYFGSTLQTAALVNAGGTAVTTVVPAGAVTGQLRVFCPNGAVLFPTFIVAQVPVISSFTPTSGPVGTVVTITGSNFTGATAVKFNNVAATTFTVNSATQITATVPATATTGKITVTTAAGTGTSATDFTVTGLAKHQRNVTLSLSKHIRAEGKIRVPDGTTACAAQMKVKLQHLKNGAWKTIDKTFTNDGGKYSTHLPDKTGKWRARVPKVTIAGSTVCGADVSPVQKHHH